MLYDPKWTAPADVMSLESLISWLEKQPADERYDFECLSGTCLLDQFITHATGKGSRPSRLHYEVCGSYTAYLHIAKTRPWTFGAALARAKTHGREI